MTWVKIDDGFLTNPKIMRAGLEARALYMAGLCYCAGGLTDGVVPEDAIAKLAALADVTKPAAAVARLLQLGLWEAHGDGYQVHDYLKYQPSAEDVRKDRQRVADWRERRRNGVQNEYENDNGAATETRTEHVRNTIANGVGARTESVRNGSGTASRVSVVPARPGPSFGVKPEDEEPPNPPLARGARRNRISPGFDDQDLNELPRGESA